MAFQRLKRGGKTAIAAMQCVLQSSSAPSRIASLCLHFLAKCPILFLYCFSAGD